MTCDGELYWRMHIFNTLVNVPLPIPCESGNFTSLIRLFGNILVKPHPGAEVVATVLYIPPDSKENSTLENAVVLLFVNEIE